jgi:glycosyltransferase involved in cell wall biosynthesis
MERRLSQLIGRDEIWMRTTGEGEVDVPRTALRRVSVFQPVGDMASQRRIRVAYCLDSFAIGGTELNALRTAEALDPDRIELFILHLQTRGPLRSRYERLGVTMKHLPIPNLYSPRTAVQGVRLARQLRRWGVDVMHSHDIYCNIFAVPWVRVLCGCSIIASRRWWYEAPRPELVTANRLSCLLAHRVLANSSGVADLLAREEGVPQPKIVEIPNFLAESAFDVVEEAARIEQRRAWGVPDGAFAVGVVARLSPVKNHGLLLRALARLDARFHLVVIGDGPSRAELAELARRLEIAPRVHFAGEVIADRNLHQFFDVSVLCSLSEGFPNSVIEAMAAAKPVVATPVGGVADAVTHGVTGILVPVDDPGRLADALQSLEADAALRTRLGMAGRDAARLKFRQDVVIDKLCTLYETLADRRRAQASRHTDG